MRVQAIGVKRMSGPKGKNSGRPFDFSQLAILKPIELVAKESFQLQGYGFEVSELEVSNEAVTQFAQVKFPAALDLVIDNISGRDGLQAIVVGFTQPVAVKAVA